MKKTTTKKPPEQIECKNCMYSEDRPNEFGHMLYCTNIKQFRPMGKWNCPKFKAKK